MHRARSLAAQCVRDLARSSSRCSVGAAGAVDRLVRCNDTAIAASFRADTRRRCLHSNPAAAEGSGAEGLQVGEAVVREMGVRRSACCLCVVDCNTAVF